MLSKKKIIISTIIFSCALKLAGPGIIFADLLVDKVAQQADLQRQLLEIQKELESQQQLLAQTQAEKNTLANKIKGIKKQQDIINLQIQSTNLEVNELGEEITIAEQSMASNNQKSSALKEQIGEFIRQIYENDNYPFLYLAVSRSNLSDVFDAYNNYSKVSDNLAQAVDDLKMANSQLKEQGTKLNEHRDEAEKLLVIKALQQEKLNDTVDEQNVLLKKTQGREADYQIVVNDTRRRAGEIQSRIYQLLGISSQITFGEAFKISQWAEAQTGIRPAFLLAILTQESNLGKNVGTCNRLNDPPEKSYSAVMKPDRDIKPFLQITSELGLDPNVTPVSCPMRDKRGRRQGWGGAMGPAQFIPSTWMGYKNKVKAITGKTANPWDIRDAFLASAIKLKAGGADGTYKGEWNAAMRYFSGGTNARYRFYGDNVMSTATKYQSDINDLAK